MSTTPKNRFWNIYATDQEQKRAEWVQEEVDLEQIVCPVEGPSGGRRLTDLSVLLRGGRVDDFVWTWLSECLIQDHVLQFFREQGYTGFEVKPVKACFKKERAEPPPRLWELVVTGWGGMAPPESGVRLTHHCPSCGRRKYSCPTDPGKLIDERQWDGSDFFIVWPLPKFLFVTDRVARAIRKRRFTGVRFVAPENLEFICSGLSPGRLSYSMPEARARELGEPLGIY